MVLAQWPRIKAGLKKRKGAMFEPKINAGRQYHGVTLEIAQRIETLDLDGGKTELERPRLEAAAFTFLDWIKYNREGTPKSKGLVDQFQKDGSC
jgi:hypothetical protein